jgi:pimeloyl-ACP methyl ester carboxylesterase
VDSSPSCNGLSTLPLGDRVLRVYDVGEGVSVFWHHGTPDLGLPSEPPFRDGLRWVSYDRPGYGGSTAVPDRTVAFAAADISHIADKFGIPQFIVVGHSACS